MKNVKQNTARWLCLIFIVSMVVFTCCGCQKPPQQALSVTEPVTEPATEPVTEAPIEYKTTLLAQIDYIWQEDQIVTSFEVLEDEGKILLEVETCKIIEEMETEEGFVWAESQLNLSEGEEDIFWVAPQVGLYEWDIENGTMREIDLGGYATDGFVFDGRTVVFAEQQTQPGIVPWYQARVEDGQLKDVSPLKTDVIVYHCYDLSGSTVLFHGETGEFFLGTLEDGVLTNPRLLEDITLENNISTVVLVGEDPSVFAETISFSEEMQVAHQFLGSNCVDAKVDGLIEADEIRGTLPLLSTNVAADKLYYMDWNSNIYEAPLSAFVREAVQPTTEKEAYAQGTYSCDRYDTGNFTLEYRSKTGEEGKSGVYYEIFVRAFADSDGDGIGDFNGITENLDYLQELGIDGIWLMPINASPSYHGYDVTDYLSVNSEYGTEEDFKRLLEEAHKRGIRVIMDFVINHTSNEHPWFQAALADENSPYRDYYRWVHKNDAADYNTGDRSDWDSRVWHKSGDFYYYGMFNAGMPDLNYNNPAVREAIKAAAGKWLEMGVDGFRLDAAMHIYGANEFKQETDPTGSTLAWWNEFARYCESINPDVYLVGEAWHEDAVLAEYVQPFDTKFNFAFQEKLLGCVIGQTALTKNQLLSVYLQDILSAYDEVDSNYLDGVFGSNHDQDRIMSTIGSAAQAKQVAAVYLTLPGNPFIYYGEELGMLGAKPDEMIRTPFLWGKESSYHTSWIADPQNTVTPTLQMQKGDPNSMFSCYQTLIALRKASPALTKGSYEAVDLGNDSIMAYIREAEGQRLLVIHNFSAETQTLNQSGYTVEEILFSTEGTRTNFADDFQIHGNETLIIQLA